MKDNVILKVEHIAFPLWLKKTGRLRWTTYGVNNNRWLHRWVFVGKTDVIVFEFIYGMPQIRILEGCRKKDWDFVRPLILEYELAFNVEVECIGQVSIPWYKTTPAQSGLDRIVGLEDKDE